MSLPANVKELNWKALAILPPPLHRSPDKASHTVYGQNIEDAHIFKGSGEDHFISYHPHFLSLLSSKPSLKVVAERDYPFVHESGVWFEDMNEVVWTGNGLENPRTGRKHTEIVKTNLATNECTVIPHKVPHPCGATINPEGTRVIFCSQGEDTLPGSITQWDPQAPHATEALLTNYRGLKLSSPNDIAFHFASGWVVFTDPCYGYMYSLHKHKPESPSGTVYAWHPSTGFVDVIISNEGYVQPNGICFSPARYVDGKYEGQDTVYVTDSGYKMAHDAVENFDIQRPRAVYAYDFKIPEAIAGASAGAPPPPPRLYNRRLFAYCDSGIPDGIKADIEGNIWVACGDGVRAYSPEGQLLGLINISGGCSNFVFVGGKEVLMANEYKLYRAKLGVQGAYLTEKQLQLDSK